MSPGAWYLAGLGLATAIGSVVLAMAPPGIRNELAGGMAVGVLVQAPLGWWHVRTLGTGGLLTVVAAFLGFGGTMWWLIRSLRSKDDEQS